MATAWQSSAWIEVSEDRETLILRICGDIDVSSREYVEPAVLAVFPRARSVILDLGDVTFCDSTGIAMFVAIHEKARAEGATLIFGNLPPAVARIFALSGVDQHLTITDC